MNSKGKLYVKHLEKAKYVVKGRKLKSDIAIVTKKDTSSNVIMTCKDLTQKIGCLYPTNNIKYTEESKYSEVDFEIKDETDEKIVLDFEVSDNDIKDSSVATFVPVCENEDVEEKVDEKIEKVLAKIAEEKEFYAKEDLLQTSISLKLDDCAIVENSIIEIDEKYAKELELKQKEIKVATEAEISKEQVEAKIKELKAREKSVSKHNKKQKQVIDEKIGNIVTDEEVTRGIVSEKKETVSQSQLDELERLRLLELARVKKESLDKERIEKAKAKKEEKIKQEVKNKEREEKNKQENTASVDKKVVQLKEVKETKEAAKKKSRKSETRSFAVVAALLAIVIVAGMANIGGSLMNQISKDNVLVGEADESNKEQPSLIKDLYQNINNTFNNDDKTEETTEEPIGIVDNDTVVVADGSGNETQENKGGTMVENKNDIFETLEDSKLPTAPMQPLPEEDIPKDNPGEETGAVEDEETIKYVEIEYSATGFKLYNASKNSVTRTQVLGGECKEYTNYNISGGKIQIPKDESQGLWFVVKDGKVEVEFSFKQGNALDAASIILMKIEDGVETEEEVIYAQRGSTVDLGGTYYTRDDEGNKIEDKTSLSNVIGKIILFKK